jgi:NAD(P)H-hydrate epimerase
VLRRDEDLILSPQLTSLESSTLDRNSEYLGISTLQLMENAGRSVADLISARFGAGSLVVFYCGTGRNGGDGMVAARHLAGRNFRIVLRLVGNSKMISDPIVRQNWLAVKSMSGSVSLEECGDSSLLAKTESDVLVDAVLGTGAKGKLRQPILGAVQAMNLSRGFKVAVDVPTGIDSDTGEVLGEAVHANLTVTFHATKPGLSKAKDFCGEINIIDIGIPPEASTYAGPGDVDAVKIKRPPEAHKGEYGRLLVIGGSETFTGAPTLVALAAYRTGTDLVFIAAPEKTALAISSISPTLITIKLPGQNLARGQLHILREQIERATAIAIGPGLGESTKTLSAIRSILTLTRQLKKPLLVDADALKSLGVIRKRLFHTPTVLTPHAGEFKVIAGKTPSKDLRTRAGEVKAMANTAGSVVLLKGGVDVISDGERVKFNATGNPGMTVGGTGDVLSGITAGLLAQGVDAFRAATAGAFISGAAGDLAEEALGYHLTPTDILTHIPKVMNDPMCHKTIHEKRLR